MRKLEGPLDPNATLEEIRSLVRRGRFQDLSPEDSHRLVELVEELDSWLAQGGFLPAAWLTPTRQAANVASDERSWWVRPVELAIRYGGDGDKLLDTINPEDLSDRQFDLVMAAKAICEQWTATMTTPEE